MKSLLEQIPRLKKPDTAPTPPRPFPADWLEKYDAETLERLAIRTVDGGLTDEQAIQAEALA